MYFLLFGRVGVFFCAVWAGGVFFFLLFGRVACSFFCCLGRGFAVWAGAFFFFCCLGGGQEFTHLPVCLALLQATQQQKRPNSKKKKKKRVPSLL